MCLAYRGRTDGHVGWLAGGESGAEAVAAPLAAYRLGDAGCEGN